MGQIITLKQCPFCGGDAMIEESVRFESRQAGFCQVKAFSVLCQDEDCIGSQSEKYFHTEENAVKAWNCRAGDA